MKHKSPELRQNPVSGDWVLVAPGRRDRPQQFVQQTKDISTPRADCPFENPQKAGNGEPLVWFSKNGRQNVPLEDTWRVQVVKNKYPAVTIHEGACPVPPPAVLNRSMEGFGYHEVVVFRDHDIFLADMTKEQAGLIIRAYQDRIRAHKEEDCLKYSLVFHNHGSAAGASIWHPHSQIIALPIIPPDVFRSLRGSLRNREKYGKCVHCELIDTERREGTRVVYSNGDFVVVTPFASHANFEMRIFPLKHESHFERTDDTELLSFADTLVAALRKLKKVLENPAYNFFIHTAPLKDGDYAYYHWHLEILPQTNRLAGVELGTGIELITMPPEDAAAYLRDA